MPNAGGMCENTIKGYFLWRSSFAKFFSQRASLSLYSSNAAMSLYSISVSGLSSPESKNKKSMPAYVANDNIHWSLLGSNLSHDRQKIHVFRGFHD